MVKKVAQKCTSVADEVASPAAEVASQEGVMDVVESSSYTGLPNAKRTNKAPTVQDIIVDPITQLASEHWSSQKKGPYSSQMVKDIYVKEIVGGNWARFQLLEVSSYLENYLWPHFSVDKSSEHTLSIVLMINEKYKNGISALEDLAKDTEKVTIFFESVVDMYLQKTFPLDGLLDQYLLFLINTFRSLENSTIRQNALRYLSLPIWEALSQSRLSVELSSSESLATHWQGYLAHKKDLLKSAQKASSIPASTPAKKSSSASASKSASAGKRKRKDEPVEEPTSTAESTSSDAAAADGITSELASLTRDSTFFPTLVQSFLTLACTDTGAALPASTERYLERFAELLIDLLSQLPTRRFLKVLLDDSHFVIVCRRSPVLARLEGNLFDKLLSSIDSYLHFEVDDLTGQALTPQDMMERSNAKIHALQQVAYSDFPEALRDLVFCSVGELSKKQYLLRHIQLLDLPQLVKLAQKLGVLSDQDLTIAADATAARNTVLNLQDEAVLWELLVDHLVPRPSHLDELNLMPLYPTESLLWDYNTLPLSHYSGNEVLALPKLNLQFLSIHDYLLRNFTLFRLESAYEIRDDLTDAIKRMGPKAGLRGAVNFGGWARMAVPIVSVSVDEVTKPKLGELVPRSVDCTVTIDISRYSGDMRQEWESFREHDVVFLVAIQAPHPDAAALLQEYDSRQRAKTSHGKQNKHKQPKASADAEPSEEEEFFDFARVFGVKYVRGGELFELRDEANHVLNDPSRPDERKSGAVGNQRRLRLHLDPAQYYADMRDGEDCYECLNLLVRRNAKENNFKAILHTIRDLINTAAVGRAIPAWLNDVFLGYGRPEEANYRHLTASCEESIDYGDTFLDAQHVIEAFPHSTVKFESASGSELPPPPYRITKELVGDAACASTAVTASGKKSKKSKTSATPAVATTGESTTEEGKKETLVVRSYALPNQGPYPTDAVPLNTIRYTPTQVEAIRSGTNRGLTMVVGPPGTGKTDVAVQIIVNLYRNHPTQKILIVTHSNAALNDLFEKIMARDVAPRHLLRLGSGESELRENLSAGGAAGGGKGQGEAFSKQGRVNWSLSRRLQLLAQVQRLSASINVPGDFGNTCETAAYFQLEHVQSRIEKFRIDLAAIERAASGAASTTTKSVSEIFPFGAYFSDSETPLFSGELSQDKVAAEGCFVHINKIFSELSDYRAFELLRSQNLRADFLLTKQARIVAMTCTHAAMTRGRLVELGFKYDSIVMEEAAQVLEVETLIPMLLQDTDRIDGARLQRVVLIGDHHQLPPVVKHAAFQKFSRLDQSMFTRFVRLGVPCVQLDRQGRARAEIAALYSWRYNQSPTLRLDNLEHVLQRPAFLQANAGFAHTFQFVDVGDFQGKGEACPTPHFFQNLGEAEYVVAVYQYMRLLGYPAEKISILTTYNGQKSLIQDIVAQRCKNPIFGLPGAISTVDKYQGQQNDYVLLSLVRTESVGHVRDIRRLVVALSRARLGLYVFGREALFSNCYELSTAFGKLRSRGNKLQLVAGEAYPHSDRTAASVEGTESTAGVSAHTVEDVTALGVLVYQMVQQAQSMQQQQQVV